MSVKNIFYNIKVAIRMFLYHIQYKIYKSRRTIYKVLSSEETVDWIISHSGSVARFGDGEIELITSFLEGYAEHRASAFQNYDASLAMRLKEILSNGYYEGNNLLVCLPNVMFCPSGVKKKVERFWERCFVNNRNTIECVVNRSYIYGDTNFTRFYIDYINKNKSKYVKEIKKIWQDREICIIEGHQSRLGVRNDLFANAKKIERILCPAVNAFNKYDEILSRALKVDKKKLILLALGQTATVLAYDLSLYDYQAIDLGHIDLEYEWFLMQADEKVVVPNKYVNELVEGRIYTEECDMSYISQIIDIID